ncbi:hypothetical protein Sme01_13710 [Sphaerisporangium melleum]|uniref:AAA domain-containing protein n=1 Tax=Sphaerisporangium melleum TaxID=321316 RepID=A0A917QU24_9ACTN|nr:conjugal transfer protein [Sphaerisporangium melleum]GGK68513.1 hypothetical protein GCM10007964_09310 [Sphaerisporangium melleum]GII68895.1 hypothetical protein Sme01_13710 [Sphaerisporangium melleum]
MDLPTYTNIWRIEKRLYKLYDLRLPMPLPIVWIGVFLGVLVPWSVLLSLLGVPLETPWHVLYLVPPGLVTWLSTRPVIESKRLNELLQSQLRYLGEPRTWCRLAPAEEPDEITFTARVWRSPAQVAPETAASAAAESAKATSRSRRGTRAKPRHTAPRKRALPGWSPARQLPSVKQAPSRPGAAVPGEVRPAVAAAAAAVTTLPTAEPPAPPSRRSRVTWGSAAARPASSAPAIAPPPAGGETPAASGAAGQRVSTPDRVILRLDPSADRLVGPRDPSHDRLLERPAPATGLSRAPSADAPATGLTNSPSGVPAAPSRGLSRTPSAATPPRPATGLSRTGSTDAPGPSIGSPRAPSTGVPASSGGLSRTPSADAPSGSPGGPARTASTGLPGTAAGPSGAAQSGVPAGASGDATGGVTGGVSAYPPVGPDTGAEAAHPAAGREAQAGPPPIGTEALRRLRRLAASAEGRGASATAGPASPTRAPESSSPARAPESAFPAGAQEAASAPGASDPAASALPGRPPERISLPGARQALERSAPQQPAVSQATPGTAAPEARLQGEARRTSEPQAEAGPVAGEDRVPEAERVPEVLRAAEGLPTPESARGHRSERAPEGVPGPQAAQVPQAEPPVQEVPGPQPEPPAHGVLGPQAEPVAQGVAGPQAGPVAERVPGPQAERAGAGVPAAQAEGNVREQHRKGQPPRAGGLTSRPPEPRTAWPVSRPGPVEAPAAQSVPEAPAAHGAPEVAGLSRREGATPVGGPEGGGDIGRGPRTGDDAVTGAGSGAGTRAGTGSGTDAGTGGGPGATRSGGAGRVPARPAAREQAPPLSIRAVPAGPGATADPAAPSVAVPVPRPGDEPRVRRVESVVGRDQSGGWRRLAQVVVGGGGPNRGDAVEMDEARARTVLAGSRRIVVLGCTGGAGQTTTTLMLGHTLARYREDRVLAVDANIGDHTLTGRIAADSPETLTSLLAGLDGVSGYLSMRAYTTRCESGLEVVGSDADPAAAPRLTDRGLFSDARLAQAMRVLDRHYRLILVDPAASMAARMLSHADQLVLVAPASEDAPDAVAMTLDWLDGHGSTELRRRAVLVVNGVSRRSMAGVEQAEAVASGRCRAIVRIPWEDELAPGHAGAVQLAHLRAGGRRAYVALAGVVVSGLAVASRPSEEEVAQ